MKESRSEQGTDVLDAHDFGKCRVREQDAARVVHEHPHWRLLDETAIAGGTLH